MNGKIDSLHVFFVMPGKSVRLLLSRRGTYDLFSMEYIVKYFVIAAVKEEKHELKLAKGSVY